jgi:hypothetical protein
MRWTVEVTEELADWYEGLAEGVADDIDRVVGLLEAHGPHLPFGYSEAIASSTHPHLRELRLAGDGQPVRIFYACDPRRDAILLIGGNRTGSTRFYAEMIARADRLHDECIIAQAGAAAAPGRARGHRPYEALRARMAPERRARNAAATAAMLAAMARDELRQARARSQEALACALAAGEPAVATLERRTDMYVSQLRRCIEALGGSLEIIARFGEAQVAITNFAELGAEQAKEG